LGEALRHRPFSGSPLLASSVKARNKTECANEDIFFVGNSKLSCKEAVQLRLNRKDAGMAGCRVCSWMVEPIYHSRKCLKRCAELDPILQPDSYLRRACTSCSVAARQMYKFLLVSLEYNVLPSGEKASEY
jgi:hypothetical protein